MLLNIDVILIFVLSSAQKEKWYLNYLHITFYFQAFRNHLMAKGHVMNVIDARSAKKYKETREILDIDLQPDGWYEKSDKARTIILKQAKLIMKMEIEKKKRDLENFNKDPKNFFAVKMSSRKTATMEGDTVRITSFVQSTIDVKEFSNDRFFGKNSWFQLKV